MAKHGAKPLSIASVGRFPPPPRFQCCNGPPSRRSCERRSAQVLGKSSRDSAMAFNLPVTLGSTPLTGKVDVAAAGTGSWPLQGAMPAPGTTSPRPANAYAPQPPQAIHGFQGMSQIYGTPRGEAVMQSSPRFAQVLPGTPLEAEAVNKGVALEQAPAQAKHCEDSSNEDEAKKANMEDVKEEPRKESKEVLKEEPKEVLKEEPKEESKEEPKEATKEAPREAPTEAPKEVPPVRKAPPQYGPSNSARRARVRNGENPDTPVEPPQYGPNNSARRARVRNGESPDAPSSSPLLKPEARTPTASARSNSSNSRPASPTSPSSPSRPSLPPPRAVTRAVSEKRLAPSPKSAPASAHHSPVSSPMAKSAAGAAPQKFALRSVRSFAENKDHEKLPRARSQSVKRVKNPEDPFDLQRFVDPQRESIDGSVFEKALSEIQAGRKSSCWMWYIIPSPPHMKNNIEHGSALNRKYAIRSDEEALAFINFEEGGLSLRDNYYNIMFAANEHIKARSSRSRVLPAPHESRGPTPSHAHSSWFLGCAWAIPQFLPSRLASIQRMSSAASTSPSSTPRSFCSSELAATWTRS